LAEIIIEVLNRLGHVSERHKFEHLPVTVGRSYRNDLIIADQHVSPQHLLISQGEQGQQGEQSATWKIHDQGSHNGMFLKRANSTVKRVDETLDWVDMDSGDEVIIGKTRLRFYSTDHPVAETQMLPKQDALSRVVGKPLVTSTILLGFILFYILNHQLSSSKPLSADKLIAMSLPPVFISLAWAGIWAFVGRVLKHEANFSVQFSITLLFTLSILLLSNTKEYLLYNSGSSTISMIVETLATGMLLATLLYINMENSTNTSMKTRLWTSHGVAWGILLAGMFLSYANKPDFRHSPNFPSVLKPPFAKVVPSEEFADFLKDSEELFEQEIEDKG